MGGQPATTNGHVSEGDKAYAEGLNIDQDPAEPYRGKLRTCERSPTAVNETYYKIPEEIRQDCQAEYTRQLKSVSMKK
jgi:hypothetical protein